MWRLVADVFDGDVLVARGEKEISAATISLRLKIPEAKLWSPESPHLYALRLRLLDGDELLDEVESYAGLRKIELRNGFCLINGEPTYLRMILDQGYWPESYLAAPSDDALRQDVEWAKKFGFNGIRKHQ